MLLIRPPVYSQHMVPSMGSALLRCPRYSHSSVHYFRRSTLRSVRRGAGSSLGGRLRTIDSERARDGGKAPTMSARPAAAIGSRQSRGARPTSSRTFLLALSLEHIRCYQRVVIDHLLVQNINCFTEQYLGGGRTCRTRRPRFDGFLVSEVSTFFSVPIFNYI